MNETPCCNGSDPACPVHGIAASNDRQNTFLRDYDRRRPRPRLTRQERLQGLADSGCDTWEEYRGER